VTVRPITVARAGAAGSPDMERIEEIEGIIMNILLIVVAIIAIILLFTGGFVQSLNFLLWVGIVLLILAVIVWLVRMMTGSRGV
jgi:hypothetical protein